MVEMLFPSFSFSSKVGSAADVTDACTRVCKLLSKSQSCMQYHYVENDASSFL